MPATIQFKTKVALAIPALNLSPLTDITASEFLAFAYVIHIAIVERMANRSNPDVVAVLFISSTTTVVGAKESTAAAVTRMHITRNFVDESAFLSTEAKLDTLCSSRLTGGA